MTSKQLFIVPAFLFICLLAVSYFPKTITASSASRFLGGAEAASAYKLPSGESVIVYYLEEDYKTVFDRAVKELVPTSYGMMTKPENIGVVSTPSAHLLIKRGHWTYRQDGFYTSLNPQKLVSKRLCITVVVMGGPDWWENAPKPSELSLSPPSHDRGPQ